MTCTEAGCTRSGLSLAWRGGEENMNREHDLENIEVIKSLCEGRCH